MAGMNLVHADLPDFPHHHSAFYQSSQASQPDPVAIPLHSPNDFGGPVTAPITHQSDWAAKEAWAEHQAVIKQLYVYEKKPLPEVMRLMESQHGFRATLTHRALIYVSRPADVP